MTAALVVAIAVAFVEMVLRLRLFSHAGETARISREAMAVVRSGTMSDDEKEAATRRSSLALFRQTGLFVGKLLIALVLPLALVAIAGALGPVSTAAITAALLSPLAIAAMTVVAALYGWARHAVARRL
ncbi:hypothetical protein GF314_13480 [bacterium]|nr:hypothetical protein [bacterium]